MRQYETYQHFRGGLYLKLGEATHTESGEAMVIYVCAVSGLMWCRPKAMFDEIVTEGDYHGPRFIRIPDDTTKEQRKLVWLKS